MLTGMWRKRTRELLQVNINSQSHYGKKRMQIFNNILLIMKLACDTAIPHLGIYINNTSLKRYMQLNFCYFIHLAIVWKSLLFKILLAFKSENDRLRKQFGFSGKNREERLDRKDIFQSQLEKLCQHLSSFFLFNFEEQYR